MEFINVAGMMGSGKTTVGKVLSESLGYSFVDWLAPNITSDPYKKIQSTYIHEYTKPQ